MAASYGDKTVESLQVETVELALGVRAGLRGNVLSFAGHDIPLDAQGRIRCGVISGPAPHQYGIDQLLNGTIAPNSIRGKVVVLGYARAGGPTLLVAGRNWPLHELFYRQVACLARLMAQP